jgi:hypothetical protein
LVHTVAGPSPGKVGRRGDWQGETNLAVIW